MNAFTTDCTRLSWKMLQRLLIWTTMYLVIMKISFWESRMRVSPTIGVKVKGSVNQWLALQVSQSQNHGGRLRSSTVNIRFRKSEYLSKTFMEVLHGVIISTSETTTAGWFHRTFLWVHGLMLIVRETSTTSTSNLLETSSRSYNLRIIFLNSADLKFSESHKMTSGQPFIPKLRSLKDLAISNKLAEWFSSALASSAIELRYLD